MKKKEIKIFTIRSHPSALSALSAAHTLLALPSTDNNDSIVYIESIIRIVNRVIEGYRVFFHFISVLLPLNRINDSPFSYDQSFLARVFVLNGGENRSHLFTFSKGRPEGSKQYLRIPFDILQFGTGYCPACAVCQISLPIL